MKKRQLLTVGTMLQNRYRIARQIKSGGMGAIYEALDERIDTGVALKETFADDDETRYAFQREAKMLASMRHEAIPRVTDYFADGDGYFLVMELVDGQDLLDFLKEHNAPLDTGRFLSWADQILDALEYLHSENVFHCDIKPENLKLTPRGRIKLLDFGIAKGATGEMTVLQTSVGILAASRRYAPLEQILKSDEDEYESLFSFYPDRTKKLSEYRTTAQTDLYALGATFYHLLTNTPPVKPATRALAVWSGQADKLIPAHEINPRVSKELSAILEKAVSLEPQNRPSSASEMRRMLREINTEETFKKAKEILAANKKPPAQSPQPLFQKTEKSEDSANLPGKEDPLFEDALRTVISAKRASTSLLQRHLRIGYGRAAAILDAMVREGYIGEMDGSTRARAILQKAYDALQDIEPETLKTGILDNQTQVDLKEKQVKPLRQSYPAQPSPNRRQTLSEGYFRAVVIAIIVSFIIFIAAAVFWVKSLEPTIGEILSVKDNSSKTTSVQTPTEAYKMLYAAVKSKDTEKIKKMMSKDSLIFAEGAAKQQNKPVEKVLENGFYASTFAATLPPMRDERVKDNFGALEVWNEKDRAWEDVAFIKESDGWKIAVGEVFKGTYQLPGKSQSTIEKEKKTSNKN